MANRTFEVRYYEPMQERTTFKVTIPDGAKLPAGYDDWGAYLDTYARDLFMARDCDEDATKAPVSLEIGEEGIPAECCTVQVFDGGSQVIGVPMGEDFVFVEEQTNG